MDCRPLVLSQTEINEESSNPLFVIQKNLSYLTQGASHPRMFAGLLQASNDLHKGLNLRLLLNSKADNIQLNFQTKLFSDIRIILFLGMNHLSSMKHVGIRGQPYVLLSLKKSHFWRIALQSALSLFKSFYSNTMANSGYTTVYLGQNISEDIPSIISRPGPTGSIQNIPKYRLENKLCLVLGQSSRRPSWKLSMECPQTHICPRYTSIFQTFTLLN